MFRVVRLIVVFLFVVGLSTSAFAQWTEFESDDFGFRMLVPPGAKGVAQDFGWGWGGLHFAAGDETDVWVVAKKGAAASREDIREFAIEASEIPAEYWTQLEDASGTDWHGFKWVESWVASHGKDFVVAVLGVGPRGNYVIFVSTTEAEYKAGKADFDKWGDSIKVY